MSVYDDFFGSSSGYTSEKHAQYTVEEIDQATELAKKTGCTLMEALQKLTGHSLDTKSARQEQEALKAKGFSTDISGTLSSLQHSVSGLKSTASNFFGSAKPAASNANTSRENISHTADKYESGQENLNALSQSLEQMDRHLQEDFGIGDASAKISSQSEAGLEAFDGVCDAVSKHVFGQQAFLKKLLVAFKRPYVLQPEEGHARNCFLITGPEDSGRHYALTETVKELSAHKILKCSEVRFMDLSIYTAAGKDNVFLQDLYMALQAKAEVLVFESYENCHVSYLSYLSDLVLRGKCMLQDRYVLQKGQLVNVSNSFASEVVSSFSAVGKYLVFMSTQGVDSLASVLGAPFVNSLGDLCTAAPLDESSYRSIAELRWQTLLEKAEQHLGFVLNANAEAICSAAVEASAKNAGTAGVLGFFDNLLKALSTVKLEGCYAKGTEVTLTLEGGHIKAYVDGTESDLLSNLPASYTGEVVAVRAELSSIVGLKEVKEYILSLEEYYNTQKRRKEAGLKASEVSKHMIFTGNPGTGKTTIARIVSRYLKAIGVLSGGQLVEVSRADLVGRYVGHTAPLVSTVLQSAIGGVLFIDEAYSLYRGKEDTFGLEAIDTLVKGIEDHRDNLIVILAGYSKEMADFLEANSGLRSRFPNFIDFPDYTGQELLEITKITVKSKGYTLDAGTEDALLSYYNLVQATRAGTAGNGRLVRNKVEEAILNQSRRLTAEPGADLSLLESRDFDLSDLEES